MKPAVATQVSQFYGFEINCVETRQGFDKSCAHARWGITPSVVDGGNRIADDDAASPLHHEERCADNRLVIGEQVGPGGERKRFPELQENLGLSGHVMGRRGHGAEGRTAKYVLVATIVKVVGEIGRPAAKLADGKGVFSAWQFAAEEFRNDLCVKPLVGADTDGV